MTHRRFNDEQLRALEDILMGAAHADGRLENVEEEAVERAVEELTDEVDLGLDLFVHRTAFDPVAFDLWQACRTLDLQTPQERRFLLKLVARITDADQVHDVDESTYIVRVARALGASRQEYADLVVDVADAGDSQRPAPPPMPKPQGRLAPPPPPRRKP